MRKATLTLATGACAIVFAAGATITARAQGIMAIYAGGSPASAGVQISSSGSGSFTPDTSHVYAAGGSLKLITHGLYQGGIITLNKPYDIAPLLANRAAYIQVAFIPPPTPTASSGPNSGGKFGGSIPGGNPPGVNTGGGGQAGSQYGGVANGQRQTGATTERFQKAHALQNLRVVFVTNNGQAVEKRIPVSYANDEEGWKVVSVPVSALGFAQGDTMVKSVRIYGDTTGIMYIGKVGAVVDTTRIQIEPMDEKIVTANTTYRYTASAHGGATPLVYSWDWDDRDGIQDESEGKSASHMYRKPGDYKVTVTVRDPYGVKAPVTTKFNIHIP